MRFDIALPLVALLGACAGSGFDPLEGMPAALGDTVRVGSLLATPRLVVEDSRFGVEAAVAAGMRVLGYVGGLTPASSLEPTATAVFDDMTLLPGLLDGS